MFRRKSCMTKKAVDLTIRFLRFQVLEESSLPLFNVMSSYNSGQFLKVPSLLDYLGRVLGFLQRFRIGSNGSMGFFINSFQLNRKNKDIINHSIFYILRIRQIGIAALNDKFFVALSKKFFLHISMIHVILRLFCLYNFFK